MLAGSADQGYVNFLRQFPDVDPNRARLTLIETVPFPASFRQLASRYQVTTFPDMFRNSKIVIPSRPAQAAATSAMSYAGATAQSSTSSSTPRLSPVMGRSAPSRATPQWATKQRSMHFNRNGQRLDDQLPLCDKTLVESLRRQHHCRRFFLTQCTRFRCSFSHDGELSSEQIRALTKLAKEKPCLNGPRCEDPNCVAAHECVYRGRCDWEDECRYGPDMHNIDHSVARRVPVSG